MEFNFKFVKEKAQELIDLLMTPDFKARAELINSIEKQAKEQFQASQVIGDETNTGRDGAVISVDEKNKKCKPSSTVSRKICSSSCISLPS